MLLESILSGLIGAGIKKLFTPKKTFLEKVIEGTLLVLGISFSLAIVGGICYGIYELFIWLKQYFIS